MRWHRDNDGSYHDPDRRYFIEKVAHPADPSPHGTRWVVTTNGQKIGTFQRLAEAKAFAEHFDVEFAAIRWELAQRSEYVNDLHDTAERARKGVRRG